MRRLITLALLVAVLACGLTTSQRTAVRTFSQATAVFGETSAGEFVHMRDATIQMNAARMQLEPPGSDPRPLEGTFSVAAVMERTRAANALGDYGALLQALVEATPEQELETAAARFVASVRGLPDTDKRLSETQLAAIGKLVQIGGGLLVEAGKKEAIEAIVPEAEPQVAVLCDALAADLDPDGSRLAGEFGLAADELRRDAGTTLRRARDPATRAAATSAYQLAAASRARTDAVLPSASAAARELKAAHQALARALAAEEVTRGDLERYAATVRTLVETLQVLH